MRKFMFSLVLAVVSMAAAAQQTDKQMATLQHGDKTSVYYGIDAFIQAYNNAADTLDVITLSSGEFNVPKFISKSLSVYGAGFEGDTIAGIDRTFLRSSVTFMPAEGIKINGSRLEGLYIEGEIIFENNNDEPVCNTLISKCRSWNVSFRTRSYDNTIRQSLIGRITGHSRNYAYTYIADNLYICNCWIEDEVFNFPSESRIFIDHCLIKSTSYSTYPHTYTNCVLYGGIGADAVLYNNVFITSQDKAQGDYGGLDSHGNSVGVENKTFFAEEGEDGTYAPYKTFALRYPDLYRGNDGTEIGLHGGTYAWNKIPCIPRITECTIDTKDVANGTIKLSIKAEAQTKE